ncbi:ankyrin repeat domain-containing protein [Aspergillus fijiensis CBS 313.89]|uniref:Ankyrin n=1 Tax=Aspergillus fijiensis CBS 313.89 TaxID=1448319 RepID=A0A8G1W3B1_9EURO|nr:ankyrin [Aspergillus fijiensis CBS 313.89]RAK78904.1 ankyrin [Aspergillus fijiensis CBS 313.89]
MPSQLSRFPEICPRCKNRYNVRVLAELYRTQRARLPVSAFPSAEAQANPEESCELARDFLDIFNRAGFTDEEVYRILDPDSESEDDGLSALTQEMQDLAVTLPTLCATKPSRDSPWQSVVQRMAYSIVEDVLPPTTLPSCKCKAYLLTPTRLSCLDLALLTDSVAAIDFLFSAGLHPTTVLPTGFNILGTAILAEATHIVAYIYDAFSVPPFSWVGNAHTTFIPDQPSLHPLTLALRMHNIPLFQLILSHEAPGEPIPAEILLWAAQYGDVEIVRALHEQAGVDFFADDQPNRIVGCPGHKVPGAVVEYRGGMPIARILLHFAARNTAAGAQMLQCLLGMLPPGDLRLRRRLLNARSWYGTTPLMDAVRAGNHAAVRYLADPQTTSLDVANPLGMSALYLAVQRLDIQVVETLFEAGCANGNEPDDKDGRPVKPPFYAIIDAYRRPCIGRYNPMELEAHLDKVLDVARVLLLNGTDPRLKWEENVEEGAEVKTVLEEVKTEPVLEKLARLLLEEKDFPLGDI